MLRPDVHVEVRRGDGGAVDPGLHEMAVHGGKIAGEAVARLKLGRGTNQVMPRSCPTPALRARWIASAGGSDAADGALLAAPRVMSHSKSWPAVALAALSMAACAVPPNATRATPSAAPEPVVTHGGTYFLWIQRPRLTWTAGTADTVMLEFRTEEPQSPASADLVLTWGDGGRYEGRSVQGVTTPGTQTARTCLSFPIPASVLAAAIQSDSLGLEAGGIRVRFDARHRSLLAPLVSATVGAAHPGIDPAVEHAGS